MNKPMSDEDDDLLMQNFRVLHSREVNSSVKAAQLWLIFSGKRVRVTLDTTHTVPLGWVVRALT